MSTKRPTMTNVSSQEKSHLPNSASMSIEEQNIESINFKESLRFFQEQLLNSQKANFPNGNTLKCRVKFDNKRHSAQSVKTTKDHDANDEITVMYSNSKITPIPTVDTILESVRILRAIQKSQSQKGTLWTLDISPANAESIESLKSLEIEFQNDELDINHHSSCVDRANSSIEHPQDNPPLVINNHDFDIENDSSDIKQTCVSWLQATNEGGKIRIKTTKNGVTSENQGATNLTLLIDSSVSDDSCKIKSEPITTLPKYSDDLLKSLSVPSSESSGFPPNDDLEETTEDYLSCCSLSLHDDNSETKLDLVNGDRSASTESDSGLGTDKSVGSLSPVRGEETEKHSWIESSSSEYASTECSPCTSLVKIFIEPSVPEIEITRDNSSTTPSKEPPLPDSKASEFNDNDNNTPIKNSEPEETDSQDDAPSNLQDGTSTFNCEKSENEECDISQERLIETFVQPIDQVPSPHSAEISSFKEISETDTTNLKSSRETVSAKEENENNLEESSSLKDINKKNINQGDGGSAEENITRNSICHSNTEQSGAVSDENENICENENFNSNQDNEHLFNSNDSSQLKFTSTSSLSGVNQEPSLSEDGSSEFMDANEGDENDYEDSRRNKKISGLSYDTAVLTDYLYSIERHCNPKKTLENTETFDGYANIVPYGSYNGDVDRVYISVKERSLFIWENSDMANMIMKLPLSYTEFEEEDNHLIIDTRIGKKIKLSAGPNDDLSYWKEAFITQTLPLKNETIPDLIKFPLPSKKNVIIVDLGSCSTRAGILMDQPTLPELVFPTICATNKTTGKKLYGLNALTSEARKESVLSYPLRPSHYVKSTFDIPSVKNLIAEVTQKLGASPKDYVLLLCAPRYFHAETQTALVDFALKELGFKAIGLARQSIMTLYAYNTGTGVVVDIGERLEVIPMVDGYILESATSRYPIGGETMAHHLKYVLAQQRIFLPSEIENLLSQYLLQKSCYFAENYQTEFDHAPKSIANLKQIVPLHKLLNLQENIVQNISIDVARFNVPEGLFQPEMWGIDCPGVHKLVKEAIVSSGLDMRRTMAEHIYLSGGLTLIPGFKERLKNEVDALIKPTLLSQVYASPYRHHMAYLGACHLALSDSFPQVCVDLDEWNRLGQKCLKKWTL